MKKHISFFNTKKIDNWVVFAGLMFIVLPILIFLFAFTRLAFFLIGLIIFTHLIYRVMNFVDRSNSGFSNEELLAPEHIKYFLISTLLIFIWLYFSGIGSYSYQTWDFWVRNPIYYDLCTKSWPMYYNLGAQANNVTALIGGEWVAFAYYFAFWLTPACISKILHLPEAGCNFVLFIYSLIGLLIVNYLLLRLFKKILYKITLIFISFSALDLLANLLYAHKFPSIMENLEWALKYFQLSGNTTQLYYVFNQSIPIWIIMALILNLNSPKYIAAIASICFAYSPWATIGLVPIILADLFHRGSKKITVLIRQYISLCNIIIPLYMLIIFGLYFTASSGATGGKGLYYKAMGVSLSEYMLLYILYIITGFGLYYLAIGKEIFKYRYSAIIFIEMAIYPIYYIVDFNFFIRGTLPAMFIMMSIAISFITGSLPNGLKSSPDVVPSDEKILRMRKRILAVLLCIGAYTAVFNFTRNVTHTCMSKEKTYLFNPIKTFDDMSSIEDSYYILTANQQFFVHGFATKPFYMFISKRGM